MLDHQFFTPSDLTGCRYRVVQRRRFPDTPALQSSLNRRARLEAARQVVRDALPTRPSVGDKRSFTRVDVPQGDRFHMVMATLEALAAQATIITGAVVEYVHAGRTFVVAVDVLVRRPDGSYMPVVVSNHRVARAVPEGSHRTVKAVYTQRLGLGAQFEVGYKFKSHALDSYTVALAARALADLGVGSSRAGLIGQDRSIVFLLNTDLLQQGLDKALQAPVQRAPRRVKECASCRFWPHCEQELKEKDDISLFLAGDKAAPFRERGIHTVSGLVHARLGETSALARAWQEGVPLLRRKGTHAPIPRFDVELDIDVEAYLDQGAYLWGTFDGTTYTPFVTWEGVGGEHEAATFAAFWGHLTALRDAAAAEGKTFGAFCYSAHGENHWLTFSAKRFAGHPGVPTLEEVRAFIASDSWVDVFAHVKNQLVGPFGLGLKVVAPQAGFHWDADDVDGEESVHLYRAATGKVPELDPHQARDILLSYNGDDCRATAAVRDWLTHGTPGVTHGL